MATEIDRLLVRLIGDGTSYENVLDDALRDSVATAQKIQSQAKEAAAQAELLQESARHIGPVTQAALNQFSEATAQLTKDLDEGNISAIEFLHANQDLDKALKAVVGAEVEAGKALESLRKEQLKENQAIAESERIIKSVMTATERHAHEAANLKEHLQAGRITQETYNRAMKDLDRLLVPLSAKLQQVGGDIRSFGYVISGVGASISALGTGIAMFALNQAGQMEQLNISFSTMLGSAEEAEDTIKKLTQFAAKTPFEQMETFQAARGLIMFGERGDELIETLEILGNAASASSSDFGMLALIFNQVRGVGRLLTQDFRQLSTRGVISLDDIKNHFGVTRTAAQEMISEGKVSFEDLRELLKNLSKDSGRFANMLVRQSESLFGAWSTLKDIINITAADLGKELLPIAKLIVGTLSEWLIGLTELSPEMKRLMAGAIAASIGLGALVTAMGTGVITAGFLVSGLGSIIGVAKSAGLALAGLGVKATIAWAAATLGVSLVISGLIALAAALAEAHRRFGIFDPFIEAAKQLGSQLKDQLLPVWEQVKQVFNTEVKSAIDEAVQAFADMMSAVGPLVPLMGQMLINAVKTFAWGVENIGIPITKAFAEVLGFVARSISTVAGWFGMNANAIKKESEELKANNEAAKKSAELNKQMAKEKEKLAEKAAELKKGVDEFNASLKTEIQMFGLSSREAKLKQLSMAGATKEELAASMALMKRLDSMEKAKKAQEDAKKEQEKARQEVKKTAEEFKNTTKSLNEQAATFGMTSRQAQIYKLQTTQVHSSLRGLKEQTIRHAQAMDLQLTKMEQFKKLQEEAKQVTEQFKSPVQKLMEEFSKFQRMRVLGLISEHTFKKASDNIKKQLKDLKKESEVNLSFKFQGLEAGSMADLQEIRDQIASIRGGEFGNAEVKLTKEDRRMADAGMARIEHAQRNRPSGRMTPEVQVAEARLEQHRTRLEERQTKMLERLVANTDPRRGGQRLHVTNLRRT